MKKPYDLPTRYRCVKCTGFTPNSSRVCAKCVGDHKLKPIKRRRVKKVGER